MTISLSGFSQSQTRKVLFLGNSYTYANNLPQIVSDLATNTGDVLIFDSNSIGGYTLADHFDSTLSKNKILSNNWLGFVSFYLVGYFQSKVSKYYNNKLKKL